MLRITAVLLLAVLPLAPGGAVPQGAGAAKTKPENANVEKFQAFGIADLLARRAASKRSYLQFLANETLSCGVYVLPKGGADRQSPHDLDEIYYVVAGRGKFEADGETVDVGPGSVLFVQARAAHRFVDIEEELQLLVFFSKARSAALGAPQDAEKRKGDDR